MNQQPKYSDYIRHYQFDAEYYDYFKVNAFDEQLIKRRYEEFFILYPVKPDDRVLEIGSGGGGALGPLKKTPARYFPLDVSSKNVRILKERSDIPVRPVTGDAFFLPFADQSFDLVIVSEVLEHLEEPERALAGIFRVLKDKGTLLVSVPYNERITYHLCIHCNRATPSNAHLHSFNEKNMIALLGAAGFNVESVSRRCNKVTNRLRLNIMMKGLPFRIWWLFDQLANTILPKPSHMIVRARR